MQIIQNNENRFFWAEASAHSQILELLVKIACICILILADFAYDDWF